MSISISCTGDKEFIQVMKALAAKHRTSMAQLVRVALDEKYGSEIKAIEASFFAKPVASKQRISIKSNGS